MRYLSRRNAPTVPSDPREVLRKKIEDLSREFLENTSFTFFIDHEVILRFVSAGLCKLHMAMSLYAKKRAYYTHLGPDYSQRIFMQYPEEMSDKYNEIWKDFGEECERIREEYVERAMRLRSVNVLSPDKFEFEDMLMIMQVEIDDELKLLRREVAVLREKVDNEGGGDAKDGLSQMSEENDGSQGSVHARDTHMSQNNSRDETEVSQSYVEARDAHMSPNETRVEPEESGVIPDSELFPSQSEPLSDFETEKLFELGATGFFEL
jgi:hypothetical protein